MQEDCHFKLEIGYKLVTFPEILAYDMVLYESISIFFALPWSWVYDVTEKSNATCTFNNIIIYSGTIPHTSNVKHC